MNNPGFVQKKASANEFNRNVKTPDAERKNQVQQIPGEK